MIRFEPRHPYLGIACLLFAGAVMLGTVGVVLNALLTFEDLATHTAVSGAQALGYLGHILIALGLALAIAFRLLGAAERMLGLRR